MARREKVGTGKKPKGSGRRLYTDENPRDTVSIKFATPTDARKTVAKVKRINKPFARKIQILQLGNKEPKLWVRQRWLAYLRKVKKSNQKNEESLMVSKYNLKRGSDSYGYKKKLVKGLMSARRDVGKALKEG